MLKPIMIIATNLSDAWFQTLYQCVEKGRQFIIDRGSNAGQKRCEFDYITVHITHTGAMPLLPQVNPALGFPDPVPEGMDYIDSYLPYLMTGEDEEGKDRESYTYGKRICKCPIQSFTKMNPNIHIEEYSQFVKLDQKTGYYIDQMEMMIWMYKNKGHRNNQMVLQVGQPSDMLLKDPSCLRHIDTRIQDGKLHFMPYFRSWDLFGGFPANLAAIELMKQSCAAEIGVENGEIIASSKGLHIYDYVFEISEAIRGRKMDEFKNE